MSQTKILVLKRKQLLIPAAIIVVLVLLIWLLVSLIGRNPPADETASLYTAGVYQKEFTLQGYQYLLTVTVDCDRIRCCQMTCLSDAITTMYPLFPSVINDLNTQFVAGLQPDQVTLTPECRYTQTYLLNAIKETIAGAGISSADTID